MAVRVLLLPKCLHLLGMTQVDGGQLSDHLGLCRLVADLFGVIENPFLGKGAPPAGGGRQGSIPDGVALLWQC